MSTINFTYNVIVDRFRQFAAGHFQLRRFTHGEISQADLEKEAEWPWMHVKPRAINYSPGTRAFSFEIFISDLPRDKEDKTGYQAESITDCSLIFQDLINEIYLGQMFGDQVVLTRPVNSEPFVEQYTHTLTGVTGIIELNLDYDWSACSIPASWNYNTPTNTPNDGFGALQFIESLIQDGAFVSLVNDEETPGNSYYYGTDAAGIKGWYAIVDNIGLTCETLPDCAVIISIEEDIIALQTDVALKANSADLGATAFSNDYNDLDNLPTIPSGTVTSVDLTAGTGISVSGGPITSSGSITVTNSAPDQVVAIAAGTGIGVTGTYPNFTVTNSAPSSGGTVTSVAALTLGTTGTDLSSTVATGTTTPVITLNVPTASAANRGALSAADWSTFNGKFNLPALTSGSVLFSNGTTIAQDNANLFWDDTNNRLGIGTATPAYNLDVIGSAKINNSIFGLGTTGNILPFIAIAGTGTVVIGGTSPNTPALRFQGSPLNFFIGSTQVAQFFATTGNLLLQNGGTFTDAGFRLDINGTARVQGEANVSFLSLGGNTAVNNSGTTMILGASGGWAGVRVPRYFETTGSISAASLLARGTYLNQTLVATANNDVLVGLDIAPTFTNGAFTGVSNIGLRIAGALIVNSTTQGFLPPRMTTTQKNAIASPASGLVVYDTTLNKLCVRGAASWETITSI
jgi:hypothetical protein